MVIAASKAPKAHVPYAPAYRFTGHETFPCRYAWLPKAYAAIAHNPCLFTNEEGAMVALGVGKNMMRAIRFWTETTGIANPEPKGAFSLTSFGDALLGKDGFDPFLEDIRTIWLLHWHLATHTSEPLFAWDFLLNRWQYPEIERRLVLLAFETEAKKLGRNLSRVTLEQHFDTFLHSYVPTRGRKGEVQEDNLDCPLAELELIQKVGERKMDNTGRRETIYAFRREEKPEVTPELFTYCLDDFWKKRRRSEKTLTFQDVAIAPGGPGQIFKLPEQDIRQRMDSLLRDSGGLFEYRESASTQLVFRQDANKTDLLAAVYTKRSS